MRDKCPICLNEFERAIEDKTLEYNCPICGRYEVERDTLADHLFENGKYRLEGNDKRFVLSHKIKWMQFLKKNETPLLTEELLLSLLNSELPNPSQRMDYLILWLGYHSKDHGKYVSIIGNEQLSIIGSTNSMSFLDVSNTSKNEKKWIETPNRSDRERFRLTINGWEYFEQLKKGSHHTKKAFMAMKFSKDMFDIFQNHFKPAVKLTGFDLVTVADNPKAGPVDARIKVEIRNSRFIVADLTDGNQGAYWEAGFGLGLGKPVFYTCRKDILNKKSGVHFDTRNEHIVTWTKDSPDSATDELKNVIRNTLPDEATMEDKKIH